MNNMRHIYVSLPDICRFLVPQGPHDIIYRLPRKLDLSYCQDIIFVSFVVVDSSAALRHVVAV